MLTLRPCRALTLTPTSCIGRRARVFVRRLRQGLQRNTKPGGGHQHSGCAEEQTRGMCHVWVALGPCSIAHHSVRVRQGWWWDAGLEIPVALNTQKQLCGSRREHTGHSGTRATEQVGKQRQVGSCRGHRNCRVAGLQRSQGHGPGCTTGRQPLIRSLASCACQYITQADRQVDAADCSKGQCAQPAVLVRAWHNVQT